MANDPVTLITEPLIQSVSATLESEIIEENKTPIKKTSKSGKSHKQSREKKSSESEEAFIKRTKQLDDRIKRRLNNRNRTAIFSKMLEADYDKRLKALNDYSKTLESAKTQDKGTKL